MSNKKNCWEIKKCGREPGGSNVANLGVCKASLESYINSINSGQSGGRICWAIAGTLCGGKIQGSFADKRSTCLTCEVFKLIQDEEKKNFKFQES